MTKAVRLVYGGVRLVYGGDGTHIQHICSVAVFAQEDRVSGPLVSQSNVQAMSVRYG